MFKTIIFDLDGIILDTIYDLKEAVNYALKTLNHNERSLEEIREFIGDGLTNLMLRALGKTEVDEEVKASIRLFTSYYKDHLAVYTKEFEGMKELLIELKNEGFKIGVLSNKDDYAVKILCDKFYPVLIDVKRGRTEDGKVKPDHSLVDYMLEQLETNIAIYVGDSTTDAQTIIENGLLGILVDWGYEDYSELDKYNIQIVKSIEELKKLILFKQKF